jgi:3'-phosphoadenosine 5'-phosphosulfate sulfotransferase (PAPS reductase)/FAD synthetase
MAKHHNVSGGDVSRLALRVLGAILALQETGAPVTYRKIRDQLGWRTGLARLPAVRPGAPTAGADRLRARLPDASRAAQRRHHSGDGPLHPRGVSVMHAVGMLSGGRGSWAACKRYRLVFPDHRMTLLFCDTKEEDEDTYRFRDLAAANIGAELVTVADGRGIWELFRAEGIIGNTRADVCSRILKRDLGDAWLSANCDPAETVVVLGFGSDEGERVTGASQRYAANGWQIEAPLCWSPLLSAGDVQRWAEAEGLPENRLYKLGFAHSNCGGLCVKAGHAHFRHALKVIPDVYERWEREEEATRQALGKEVAILRDRRGGVTRPMTLRTFRERVEAGGECDLFDWGGCGCFA